MSTGAPFERIHVDLTGAHPRSRRGNTYILTCIDPLSNWAEAFAIWNKEATTVVRVLVEQVFCRLGVPISLLTDRGREVDGNLMNEVCMLLGVDKIRTTAYKEKASTSAAVEQFHRTLNSLLDRTIDENQKDWDSPLPYVMAEYRSSGHESTKYTPNYLMLRREVRAPVDLMYGTPTEQAPSSYDEYSCQVTVVVYWVGTFAIDRSIMANTHLSLTCTLENRSGDVSSYVLPFVIGPTWPSLFILTNDVVPRVNR